MKRLRRIVVAVAVGSVTSSGMDARAAPQIIAPTTAPSSTTAPADAINYRDAAGEVMRHIQDKFFLPKEGRYAHSLTDRHVEFAWGNGVLFSAMVAGARHDPKTYRPQMMHFYDAMEGYWDKKAKIPGYEPWPTQGGHDKYYDDNQWFVLTFAEAYEMTGQRKFLQRADDALKFSLSGWDDKLGGGIWWHEGHKENTKNTCSNAPAATACLRMATLIPEKRKQYVEKARQIVEWTAKTLQLKDGLFADSINVGNKHINTDRLTYNTALMIRAWLGLYRATGEAKYLDEAKRAAAASDWFCDATTGAYRDRPCWSHLLVEADLEMYRATGDAHLLKRATVSADHMYQTWKTNPPDNVMDNAAIARTLWLMADMNSDAGQAFWAKVDGAGKK